MFIPVNPGFKLDQREESLAKLKLLLEYDNLTQIKFFSIIFQSYLERDSRLISLLEEKNKKNSKKEKRQKDLERTKSTIYDFNLEENEINDIFDMIAKENSEL